MTALVVDQGGDLKVVFPGREIVLAFGRLVGLALTSTLIYHNHTNLALIFLATAILTLPLYLHYQSKIMKRFIYR
jgi:hypothetical protein